MRDRNYKFPSLSRDLAVIGLGSLIASAVAGAAIGVAGTRLIGKRKT